MDLEDYKDHWIPLSKFEDLRRKSALPRLVTFEEPFIKIIYRRISMFFTNALITLFELKMFFLYLALIVLILHWYGLF